MKITYSISEAKLQRLQGRNRDPTAKDVVKSISGMHAVHNHEAMHGNVVCPGEDEGPHVEKMPLLPLDSLAIAHEAEELEDNNQPER